MNQVRREFKVNRLSERGLAIAQTMSERFSDLVDYLDQVCSHSQEYDVGMRKLEEACFYFKKAMAMEHIERPQ